MRARSHPDAGFTLAEMLVSLALLGLAATLMAQAVQGDRGALRRIDAHTGSAQAVSWAQDTLRRHIEQLYPHASFVDTTPTLQITGSPRTFEMQTLVADSGAVAGVRRERLSLDAAGRLVLSAVDPAGASLQNDSGSVVLLNHVAGIDLAYYGVDPQGAAGWRNDWVNQTNSPRLVRLRVQFPSDDPRVWPEFLAAPAPTVDDACVLDPETARCRGRP